MGYFLQGFGQVIFVNQAPLQHEFAKMNHLALLLGDHHIQVRGRYFAPVH